MENSSRAKFTDNDNVSVPPTIEDPSAVVDARSGIEKYFRDQHDKASSKERSKL